MKRRIVLLLASILLASVAARADDVPVGLLSFDVLIPASSTPGVDAFDIFNLTGPIYGPTLGSPYAAAPLTFDNSTLTVYFQGGSSQVFNLGNIGPGELLDSSGNPVIQFPSTDVFTSAVFTATLSPITFTLSNGTTFTGVASISADLTPSSGSTLVAGVDFVVMDALPTPEPSTFILVGSALAVMLAISMWTRRSPQFHESDERGTGYGT